MFYVATLAQCTSNRYTAPIFPNVTTTSGIQFGSATAYNALFPQNLALDIYEPTGDTIASRPLIVYAFGGGYLIGTRIDPPIPTYCSYLAQCGYVVASIDYRIGFNIVDSQSAERAVYRGVQDLRGAVRFLCQRYPQYRIDTTAIFLTGSSAGCFSGLHSTFLEQSDWPPCIHGTTLEPADLGCIDCDDNADNGRNMPLIRGIINHWGAIFDTTYIRSTIKDNVPTINLAGDQDAIVPYNVGPPFGVPIFPNVYGSLPIYTRMHDLGIKSALHTFVGYNHEPWLLAPQLVDTCYVYELPFLYSILKPAPLTISGNATVCLNYSGTYTVRSDVGSTYCWVVVGGTITANSNNSITVLWTSAGTHILTVQELTRNKVNGNLDSFTVNVLAHPIAAFGDSVLHTNVIFSDSSVGATSWSYDFGDHSNAQHIADPTHNYNSQDTFTVRLIVGNGYCADTTYRTLITDTCPSSQAITYTTSGDTVIFTAAQTGLLQYEWHFGDGDSASGISSPHVYTHSQNYLASVSGTTAKGCKVYGSVIVPFTMPNGIEQLSEEIMMYPNPTDELLHISALPAGSVISIFDMSGQKLREENVVSGDATLLNISSLSSGMYIIKISSNNLTINYKLIKN